MVTSFFTRSNPRSLFFWLFVLPLIVVIIFMRYETYNGVFLVLGFSMAGSLAWLYFCGRLAYQNCSIKKGLSLTGFNVSFLIVVIGIIGSCINRWEDIPAVFLLLLPVLICSSFYIFFFFSKALTTAEFKKETGLMTYLGTFIFLSLLPVGILLIQPRIQKLHDPLS